MKGPIQEFVELFCVKKLGSTFCVIGTVVVFKESAVQQGPICLFPGIPALTSVWTVQCGYMLHVGAPEPGTSCCRDLTISYQRGLCFWQAFQVRRCLG